jgi:hypothetical protein
VVNKRVVLASAIVALSVALLVWVTQAARAQERPSASAPALVAAPREQTQLFLPLVLKNYMPPAPLWRFGVSQLRRPFTDYDYNDIIAMRFGWYMNFGATPNAPQPYGIEYSPVIRVKQWKLKDGSTWTECCVGCPYVTPYTYTVSPSVSQIQAMATSRPGMLWVIGNEIERIDWGVGYCSRQDEILPELYAQAYHDLYYTIKNVDYTAQVAIGGLIQFTDLRRQYLDRVWAEYTRLYSETMPVDVWNIHVYVLQEKRGDWGADIPAGFTENTGVLYTILDNKDFTKAWALVVALRTWMNQNGQRNKPLITNEYGVNMPAWVECPTYPDTTGCPFTPEQVRDSFLYPSFNYFLNQTDASIGYLADGNRLMQRWNWWSLDYDDGKCEDGVFWEWFNGSLFYSGLGPSGAKTCTYPAQGISSLGTYWKQYVQSLPSGATKPYALAPLPAAPQGKVVAPALPSYQPADSTCPAERRVRLEFYAPAQSGLSIEGLGATPRSRQPFISTKTNEMTICLPR